MNLLVELLMITLTISECSSLFFEFDSTAIYMVNGSLRVGLDLFKSSICLLEPMRMNLWRFEHAPI